MLCEESLGVKDTEMRSWIQGMLNAMITSLMHLGNYC